MARSLKPYATKAAYKALNKADNDEREEKRLYQRALAQARAQKAKEILAIVETNSDNAVKAILGLLKQLSPQLLQQQRTLTASRAKLKAVKVYYAFQVILDNIIVIKKGKYINILSKSRWLYKQQKETFKDAINNHEETVDSRNASSVRIIPGLQSRILVMQKTKKTLSKS